MPDTIEKQGRQELFDACRAKRPFLINDVHGLIRQLTDADGQRNEEAFDPPDAVFHSGTVAEINAVNNRLIFTNTALKVPERSTKANRKKMITDEHTPAGTFTDGPVYQLLRGMTKGETLGFEGAEFKTKDLF